MLLLKKYLHLNPTVFYILIAITSMVSIWFALPKTAIRAGRTDRSEFQVFSPRPLKYKNEYSISVAADQTQGQYLEVIPKARNVILFIGDGMGEEHIKAARWFSLGLDGILFLDRMDASGYLITYSANKPVTDSAAAATALASGVKTNNGVIGLDREMHVVLTILEKAEQQGKSTGLVTTTMVSHATPAAFAAHVGSRNQMNDIAEQLLSSGTDVILGGGEDEFYPKKVSGCFPEPGEREDGRNLIQEALELGYTHICDQGALLRIDPSSTRRLLGLFADEGMKEPYSPTLAEMTIKAIEVLSQNPAGYFLMVEGGQIDWAAHDNDLPGVISNLLSFDEAVKAALEMTAKSDETLIIVAADHETGAMKVSLSSQDLPGEEGPYPMPGGNGFFVNWGSTSHTARPVPVTANGPLSHWLNGIHDNTYIYDVISSALFGLEDPNSISLPADVDGDGRIDHHLVCPWGANWYIEDNIKNSPTEIFPLTTGYSFLPMRE